MIYEEAEEGDLVVNLFGVERKDQGEHGNTSLLRNMGARLFLGGLTGEPEGVRSGKLDGKNEKLGSPEFLFLVKGIG